MKRERETHELERAVLMTQIKDHQNELQSAKVSACCKHLAVQYYWDMLLFMYHLTLRMKLVIAPIIHGRYILELC